MIQKAPKPDQLGFKTISLPWEWDLKRMFVIVKS